MAAVSARPKRRLDALRRPQILGTAVELVREKGLWNVRIADVAKRAGVSPANVVYYFGSKDQLFAQAIAEADDAFYAPLHPELATLDRAVDKLAWLMVRSSESDWILWMDLWGYTRRHPETASAQSAFHRRWRATIAEVIRYGQARGEWGECAADDIAQRMSALTDGLAVHMVLGDPDHTRERCVEMTLVAAALELGCSLRELRAAAAKCPAHRQQKGQS
ncbi:MAG: TetR family transcriptional regulator C-terminal domain-containing protein [Actinomycetota bacterium]|nr:TetR family transcriptional regulator C-terminal domain-containing protein [Actinomycetota bacterium]